MMVSAAVVMNSCNVYTRVILMVITDVDECSEDTDGCSQTCSNTYGSFMCSCGSGFTLANDNLGCNGKKTSLLHADSLIAM